MVQSPVIPAGQVLVRVNSTAPGRRVYIGVWRGFAYVLGSLACSCVYLVVLEPAFANDFLVDQLVTQANGTLDVLASTASMDKSYDSSVATTDIYQTYIRRLVLSELTTVEYAVVNLRGLSGHHCMWMATQYCWVDLNQTFEIAHSTARQTRCASRYATNGAVYMETVLRNQDWDDFLRNYGGASGIFTVAIQS
ncbi:hypothetical protein As57867_003731, partial [Aphanomyces stellatus]